MEFLKRKLVILKHPTNINEAMYLQVCFLRLLGMFPYKWLGANEYKLSPWYMAVSIFHLLLYCYVNIKLIILDFEEYASPVLYSSFVGVVVQFILKIASSFVTLSVFLRIIFGTKNEVKIITMLFKCIDELGNMGFDVNILYKRLSKFAALQTLVYFGIMAWSLINGILQYERMYSSFPTFEHFFITIMSSLYKNCGVMYMCCYIYICSEISKIARTYFKEAFKFSYGKQL